MQLDPPTLSPSDIFKSYNTETQEYQYLANRYSIQHLQVSSNHIPLVFKQNFNIHDPHKAMIIGGNTIIALVPKCQQKSILMKLQLGRMELYSLKSNDKQIQFQSQSYMAPFKTKSSIFVVTFGAKLKFHEIQFWRESQNFRITQINIETHQNIPMHINNAPMQLLFLGNSIERADLNNNKFVLLVRYNQLTISKFIDIISVDSPQIPYDDHHKANKMAKIYNVQIPHEIGTIFQEHHYQQLFAICRNKVYITLNNHPMEQNPHLLKINFEPSKSNEFVLKFEDIQRQPAKSNNSNKKVVGISRIGEEYIGVFCQQFESATEKLTLHCYKIDQKLWMNPIQLLSKKSLNKVQGIQKLTAFFFQPNHLNFFMEENIYMIQFSQQPLIESQVCESCLKRMENSEKYETDNKKSPFASNCLFYNISQQIPNPFSGIGLLTDCARAMKSKKIDFKLSNLHSNTNYLCMEFDGNQLTKEEYSSIISHSYKNSPVALEIIQKIKLGAFRLGRTFLYITSFDCGTTEEKIRVFLFSANGKIISHYQQLYAYMAYEQRKKDGYIMTHEGVHHKKYIMNFLSSLFTNPSKIIKQIKKHAILIFDINILMNSEKDYYSELVSAGIEKELDPELQTKRELDDICKFQNLKYVAFLEKGGYKLNRNIEVSLISYLQNFIVLEKGFAIHEFESINVNNYEIKKFNPHQQSSDLKSQAFEKSPYIFKLQKLVDHKQANLVANKCHQTLSQEGLVVSLFICEIVEPTFIEENQGILIYYKGRLINRHQSELGHLFEEHFYKKKYHKNKTTNLWRYAGIINVISGMQPSILWTNFKKSYNTLKFRQYLNQSGFVESDAQDQHDPQQSNELKQDPQPSIIQEPQQGGNQEEEEFKSNQEGRKRFKPNPDQ